MLETGRDLAPSLVPELTPGEQVACHGHTLHHMLFLSAERWVSICRICVRGSFN